MDIDAFFGRLFFMQAAVFAGLVSLLFLLPASRLEQLYVFELVGALLASIITVFGLKAMRRRTSDIDD